MEELEIQAINFERLSPKICIPLKSNFSIFYFI